jgi:hypothetical protein
VTVPEYPVVVLTLIVEVAELPRLTAVVAVAPSVNTDAVTVTTAEPLAVA